MVTMIKVEDKWLFVNTNDGIIFLKEVSKVRRIKNNKSDVNVEIHGDSKIIKVVIKKR
jgi:hypothetical protein